jgi:hypothetical protein
MAKAVERGRWADYLMRNLDIVVSIVVFTASMILGSFELLPAKAVPIALLLMFGPFITYQVRTSELNQSSLDHLAEQLSLQRRSSELLADHLIASDNPGISIVKGEKRFYERVTDCVCRKTTRQVDVTYFSPDPPSRNNASAIAYWIAAEKRLRSDEICLRRIVTIENRAKLEWVKGMLDDLGDLENVSITVLEHADSQGDLLNMMIFDSREVFVFGPHRPDAGERHYLGILSKTAGSVFSEYFDSVWNRLATQRYLKRGGQIDTAFLRELEERFPA